MGRVGPVAQAMGWNGRSLMDLQTVKGTPLYLSPSPPPLSRHIKTVFQVRKIRIYLFTQQRELTGDAIVCYGVELKKYFLLWKYLQ
jgi:hypothetical protein